MPNPTTPDEPLSVFISYAHVDQILCERLIIQLDTLEEQKTISNWYDGQIVPGEKWHDKIQTKLTSAKLILLLVSADFLASRYVKQDELPTALARHKSGEAWVIPIILSPCDWKNSVLGELEALPEDGKPITIWEDRDEAFLNVVQGIRAAIGNLSVSPLPSTAQSGRLRIEQRLQVTRPGIFRYLLDRYLPSIHRFLSNLGSLRKPPETDVLNNYLRQARAKIENDIRQKTYVPLVGKEVSATPLQDGSGTDPFMPPLQRMIRQVAGRESGGDSASAQIAAVNRHSRVIRNIISTLLRSHDPLVLLGDPGTGKTMTLQQTALRLFDSEVKRMFPIVTLYVRLGEFHVSGRITDEDVWKYVKASVSPRISPFLEDLDSSGRLIVLFDGMDEMSRERYNEHTEALSIFAAAGKGRTKTLFSCRITDFSPRFIHRRLVLLPFNDDQIAEYLRRYIPSFPLTIKGESWTLKRLVRELLRGSLPLEATNPFVLWLLCFQLQQKGSWPASRVELLRFYIEETYQRKAKDLTSDNVPFLPVNDSLAGWSKIAYAITNLNRGAAIAVPALKSEDGLDVEELIRVGKRCGVLQVSLSEEERQIRFEHHRFQEFFTALFINEHQSEIAWLDKLDAPRWQETMLNLIVMGGGEDAIRTLAEAIESEIDPRTESALPDITEAPGKPNTAVDKKLSPQVESMLADRIELVSRILRQAGSSSQLVKARLTKTFEKAVRFLTEHGNPITQVKMMRACQNVPEIDIFQVLQNSLKSPINWVRNQALIIVSSSNRGPQVLRSHFATELGYELASGMLPLRMKAYCKAAAASKQMRNWWSLALAVIVFLFQVSVLMTVAGVLCFEAWKNFVQPTVSIDVGFFVVACLLVLIAAIAAALKFDPGKLWMAIIATGTVTFLLAWLIWNIGSDFIPDGQVLGTAFGVVIAIPLITALIGFPVALGTHSLALGIYLSATAHVRHSRVTPGSYFGAMWRNSDFRSAIDVLASFAMVGLATGVVFLVVNEAPLLAQFTGFSPGFSALLILFTIALVSTLVGAGFSAWKHKKPSIVLKALGFFAGLVASMVVGVPLVRKLNRLTSKVTSATLLPIVGLVIVLLLVMALLYTLWLFRHKIQNLFLGWRDSSMSDNSISPEEWKRKLAWADADLQQVILNQANHQTLGLNAEQFLTLLEEVATSIKHEPALSIYWEKRDRLEQVLRQERQG